MCPVPNLLTVEAFHCVAAEVQSWPKPHSHTGEQKGEEVNFFLCLNILCVTPLWSEQQSPSSPSSPLKNIVALVSNPLQAGRDREDGDLDRKDGFFFPPLFNFIFLFVRKLQQAKSWHNSLFSSNEVEAATRLCRVVAFGEAGPALPYVQDALQGANLTAHPGRRDLPPAFKSCEIKRLQKHSSKWSCNGEYCLPCHYSILQSPRQFWLEGSIWGSLGLHGKSFRSCEIPMLMPCSALALSSWVCACWHFNYMIMQGKILFLVNNVVGFLFTSGKQVLPLIFFSVFMFV